MGEQKERGVSREMVICRKTLKTRPCREHQIMKQNLTLIMIKNKPAQRTARKTGLSI